VVIFNYGLSTMSSHLGRPIRRNRRKNFRVEWNLPATIYDVGRHLERPCILVDVSDGGAKIAGVRAYTIPDEFRLRTPLGERRSCRVVWRTEDALGVEFTDRVDGHEISGHRAAVPEPTLLRPL
jgi:PilZ domain